MSSPSRQVAILGQPIGQGVTQVRQAGSHGRGTSLLRYTADKGLLEGFELLLGLERVRRLGIFFYNIL